MQTGLTQDLKTDKKIIEEILMAHMLEVALDNVGKDEAETGWHVQKTWVELLDQECAIPMEGLFPFRKQPIAKEVDSITKHLFREIKNVNLWRECALTVALLTNQLTIDNKIKNAMNQASMISALIIEENSNSGEDWGSVMKCQNSAHFLKVELNRLGYYL